MSAQPKTLVRPSVMTMATNMSHVVQLVLPLTQFVATLSRQLSWSHFVNILPLKRLDKHERQAGEEAPIGLILCAESSREQVELLQMHKDGITVAEYWTELPPKAALEQHLHQALIEASVLGSGLPFPVSVAPKGNVVSGAAVLDSKGSDEGMNEFRNGAKCIMGDLTLVTRFFAASLNALFGRTTFSNIVTGGITLTTIMRCHDLGKDQ